MWIGKKRGEKQGTPPPMMMTQYAITVLLLLDTEDVDDLLHSFLLALRTSHKPKDTVLPITEPRLAPTHAPWSPSIRLPTTTPATILATKITTAANRKSG